ncbi:hypothetical protein CLD22_17265 [Rubrivivax gelatinosus]|nr:hypothetical protein [Rubrivivax gelatinosus]
MASTASKTPSRPATVSTSSVAFALGGLAGANAHGVGFLKVALDRGLDPKLISCTSGMIHWTARYLMQRRGVAGVDIDAEMRQAIAEQNVLPPPWARWNALLTALQGKPKVFRPAWPEYLARWLRPPTEWTWDALTVNRVLPAQTFVPLFPDSYFQQIADELNSDDLHGVGVMFNAFDPRSGTEYLHLNESARRTLAVDYDEHYHPVARKGLVHYRPIDADAVRGGLWLYFYGFDTAGSEPRLDGAYRRDLIVRDLVDAARIYVVRALPLGHADPLPRNLLELEDLKTELFMNAAYAGEVANIELINKLLEDPAVGPAMASKYHRIELVPIETTVDQGFFDYFVERLDTYEKALRQTARVLGEQRELEPA